MRLPPSDTASATEVTPGLLDSVLNQFDSSGATAPLMAFLVGALIGLSPLALPSIPAAMSLISPGVMSHDGTRHRFPLRRSVPVVAAFVAGMDGVLGGVGLLLVGVAELLTRAAVVHHLLVALVLAVAGTRLLLRRASLCRKPTSLPVRPAEALLFGMVFAVGGCPACGPIALSLGMVAATLNGPLLGVAVLAAFIAGRSVVLLAAAYAGDRLLPCSASPAWRRLDIVVGVLLLVGSSYYSYRMATGAVSTSPPPGAGVVG